MLRVFWNRLDTIFRPIAASVIIGCIAGLFGSSLWLALNWCDNTYSAAPWLVWLMPAGGIAIVFLYTRARNVGGTNQVLEAVQNSGALPALMAPLAFAGTVLTRIFGGSVGSEGAAIQIGGSIASTTGRLLHIPPSQIRIVLMAGISGGFAAVVGTPVTAIVLAIELTGVGIMFYESILPCAVSSVVSYAFASAAGVSFPRYALHDIPGLAPLPIIQVTLLASLGGLLSILLCKCISSAGRMAENRIPSPYVRVIAGGIAVAAGTLLTGGITFNGGGLDLLRIAADGKAEPWDFIVKIAFTACTLGTGYRGGAIVPTLATGAVFGGFAGHLIGLSPSLSAAVGMISVFCGAINCPMTAFVLGAEVFGLDAGLYFVLSSAAGYVCSGYCSLYSSQIIHRSKLQSEIIDRRAS